MLDILGCPITVGSMVLTAGYSRAAFDTIAEVQKVNKKTISVVLMARSWTYDPTTKRHTVHHTHKTMRRHSDQVVVIDQQLAYIQANFPENLL